jgi:hypothetical protein
VPRCGERHGETSLTFAFFLAAGGVCEPRSAASKPLTLVAAPPGVVEFSTVTTVVATWCVTGPTTLSSSTPNHSHCTRPRHRGEAWLACASRHTLKAERSDGCSGGKSTRVSSSSHIPHRNVRRLPHKPEEAHHREGHRGGEERRRHDQEVGLLHHQRDGEPAAQQQVQLRPTGATALPLSASSKPASGTLQRRNGNGMGLGLAPMRLRARTACPATCRPW